MTHPTTKTGRGRRRSGWRGYAGAVALVVGTTAIGAATRAVLDVPDVEMLYVVAVLVSAVYLGRGPAVASAAVGVLAYDYFFVPPTFTLDVTDLRYLFTFAMMFGIGLLVSSLADQARDAAVRAESETLRGTLLSSVSHDLRTPLAAITGAATTLRDQAVDEGTRRELIEAICDEAVRMERLVGNLLDMTRLASGAVAARREWIPVDELIGAALARTEGILSRHHVRTEIPGAPELVSVDPVLVEQLLVNLLENAARHTPPGTEVLVRAGGGPAGLDLEVADRGPGITPGEEERVFERFHRGERATGQGAGLGLAIAQAIAEVHGGTLRVTPGTGGGASFRLHLPGTGASPPSHLSPMAISPERGKGHPVDDAKDLVLVVEDEPQMRRFLRASLGAEGYRVREAWTVADGLREAAAEHPDVILLDLGLPDGDGLDLVRRLREWSAVPVIVVSARGREEEKVAALDAGADDFLPKPFGTKELLARLRVALRHARAAAETDGPVLEVGPLRMDLDRHEASVDGRAVRLTPIEWRLLALLASHAGKVLTHAQILREVWGPNAATQSHYVRVYMAELRKKLEADPSQPRLLLTEPGIGYRLANGPR